MADLVMTRRTLADLPPLAGCVPPPYILHPATVDDAPAIARLLSAAFSDAADQAWDTDRVRRELLEHPLVRQTLVITHFDIIVATASAALRPDAFPESGYVHWVGCDPAHRGRRLGRAATLAVLHAFVGQGLQRAALKTQPFRSAAIRTYLALGFLPRLDSDDDRAAWREAETNLRPWPMVFSAD